jgi:hypothetical protein
MKLNLYKYRSPAEQLVGYNDKNRVPMVLLTDLNDLSTGRAHSSAGLLARVQELKQNRDVLAQDPESAAEAAIRYKLAARMSNRDESLFNRDPAVERVIATDPRSIYKYVRWVIEHVEPQYHEQILKGSPSDLTDYLMHFKKDLQARHKEFVKRAYERISEDPSEAFTTALHIGIGRRVPELEASVFRFNPSAAEWHDLVTEPEYMALPQTPAAGDEDDEITSSDLRYYGEYDSPWNLYVSALRIPRDRADAVAQYGFNGREFKLGYQKI